MSTLPTTIPTSLQKLYPTVYALLFLMSIEKAEK